MNNLSERVRVQSLLHCLLVRHCPVRHALHGPDLQDHLHQHQHPPLVWGHDELRRDKGQERSTLQLSSAMTPSVLSRSICIRSSLASLPPFSMSLLGPGRTLHLLKDNQKAGVKGRCNR